MHPSTIAAILAFTAGMTVNAVPVVRPEGTPEPPADKPRTTLENSRAQPQLSELAEDEFTIPSVGKRDHPPRPFTVCNNSGGPSIAIPCISPELAEQINRGSSAVPRTGVNARAIKRDSRRLFGNDGGVGSIGILIGPTAEEMLERKKQAGFRKEKRDHRAIIGDEGIRLGWDPIPSLDGEVLPAFGAQKRDPQVIDAGFGFDAGVTIDPSTITGGLKKLIPGQKEKRDPQVIDAGFGFDAGVTIDPSTIAENVKQFIPGQKEKRDPQVIDAGFGFDAGVTIDPSTITGGLKKLIPGQKAKRDPQIDAGFGFDAGVTIDPSTITGGLKKLIPGQKAKRDPQIDAGFGFDAGIIIDPIARPGHLTRLLPRQKAKRDPQNRGKGHVFGKIAEGVAGGIGAIADGFTIHQALQGKPA